MNTGKTWADLGFEVEKTADGSPSLRLLRGLEPETKGESMHHSGGAASETELIYGRVISRCFLREPQPHFLSVGLGLGYVEMTVAREALLANKPRFTLESFELVPELKSFLISWLQGEDLPLEIQSVYDEVVSFILQGTSISPAALRALLLQKYQTGEWSLQNALEEFSPLYGHAHGILFDAFSAKTTPDLWTEDFLRGFFARAAQVNCLVSTYACRAGLKRALQANGFEVQVREGFQGKRNSTLGLRGY